MNQRNLVYVHTGLTIIALTFFLQSISSYINDFNYSGFWMQAIRGAIIFLMVPNLIGIFTRKEKAVVLFSILLFINYILISKSKFFYTLPVLVLILGVFLLGGLWVLNQLKSLDKVNINDDSNLEKEQSQTNSLQYDLNSMSTNTKKAIKNIFYEDDEKFISAIGQGYLASILQGDLAKSVLILSNKRLYQKGKVFEKQPNNRFTARKGSKVIDVKNITGISYSEANEPFYLIFGIILLPIGIGLLLIGYYFYLRQRYFIVEYSGGAIVTPVKWYSSNEIDNFQKSISILKSRK